MQSRKSRRTADEVPQLRITQVVEAGLTNAKGQVPIFEDGTGHTLLVAIDGHGDYIEIYVAAGWGNTEQRIELTETPCNYGGTRKWFLCPECAKRCGVLYIRHRIACRTCYDLTYSSQYEHAQDRMLRKLKQIRRATGSDPDIWGPFNLPPRGMSVKRWKALIEEFEQLRKKYWRECEKPRKWRNSAPKAHHWKVGARIPTSPL
ncbi:hypothetical protein GQE99_01225 [Maritimibacter sp. DP07]|uniref:Uncharacterized protein n=1 Tax=Maritimibacter harenae TaxID=2606218 RepID=A0A845M2C4_9RHOB|nr:hypothetical protein [Maritimibacter harenae]MZR11653.1 hypothetical protein [Maritimibacter harenae]